MEQTGLAFSTSGLDVVSRSVNLLSVAVIEDVCKEFDVTSTAQWISSHDFKRVALQFPDELMGESIEVARLLQSQTKADIVILADTTYCSCCVDEVAAEHYCCDALVHYGHACLSPTPGKVPVWFVLGQKPITSDLFLQLVTPLVENDPSQPALLLYDTVYHHAINDELSAKLLHLLPNLIISRLSIPCGNTTKPEELPGDICFGRSFKRPDCKTAGSDYTVLFLGSADSRFLTAVLMTLNHSRCICFDPCSASLVTDFWQPGRALARRYYLVERARDAQRIGILVGTLAVADYLQVIEKIESVAKAVGKSVYRFVVGKLNVAKLANFADIDVFVLVACPENSLLDSKEFYQPIITPFELEIACDTSRQWTGSYELDFKNLFLGYSNTHEPPRIDREAPDVSLITGRVRMMGHSTGIEEEVDRNKLNVLMKRNELTMVAIGSAGSYFSERSWQGLDPQLGKTPVTTAVDGPCGIAMSYSNEPAMSSSVERVGTPD